MDQKVLQAVEASIKTPAELKEYYEAVELGAKASSTTFQRMLTLDSLGKLLLAGIVAGSATFLFIWNINKDTIKINQDTLQTLERQRNALRELLSDGEAQLVDLQKQSVDLTAQVAALGQERDTLVADRDRLEQVNATLLRDNDDLQQQVAARERALVDTNLQLVQAPLRTTISNLVDATNAEDNLGNFLGGYLPSYQLLLETMATDPTLAARITDELLADPDLESVGILPRVLLNLGTALVDGQDWNAQNLRRIELERLARLALQIENIDIAGDWDFWNIFTGTYLDQRSFYRPEYIDLVSANRIDQLSRWGCDLVSRMMLERLRMGKLHEDQNSNRYYYEDWAIRALAVSVEECMIYRAEGWTEIHSDIAAEIANWPDSFRIDHYPASAMARVIAFDNPFAGAIVFADLWSRMDVFDSSWAEYAVQISEIVENMADGDEEQRALAVTALGIPDVSATPSDWRNFLEANAASLQAIRTLPYDQWPRSAAI